MFGMKLPQGDTSFKRKVPKVGPDDNPNTIKNEHMTAPKMAQGDGPARDSIDGGTPKKPATSAKAPASKVSKKTMKSMKASIGAIGRF